MYLIEGDCGVSIGGESEIDNAGTIRKTDGSGTSQLAADGPLINTGTIEADSGTISLVGTIPQISQGTLKAGTWNALNGSSLEFPSGTSIVTNQATIAIDGVGAAVTGMQGLSASSGSFSLTNDASFTTTGDFSNTGSLTIGAGSTLAVTGDYTQGSAASLTIGIGGSRAGQRVRPACHCRYRHAGRLRQCDARQRLQPCSRYQLSDHDLRQRDRGR